MYNQELIRYISQARSQNIPDENIKTELMAHGWPESDVLAAFNAEGGTKIAIPIPPPPPVPHFGMWIAFQYILLFISLYVCATAFGGILHHAVDTFIPDPLDSTMQELAYTSYIGNYLLKGYLAAIIVMFPLFALLFLIAKKQTIDNPAVRNIKTRKFLIYTTLVVTFIIMISNFIGTIFGLLNGSITTRWIGHLMVTLGVAGSIFFYLLNEVRIDRKNI